tara:strand:- start:9805 stop:10356 length:552 start_codon:yes stop_codon:yes gene_type:complete
MGWIKNLVEALPSPISTRRYNSLEEVIELSPRAAAPVLTKAMLPPSVRDYVPEDLQDRDLPLWYAAFETGRQAAQQADTYPLPAPKAKAERIRPAAALPETPVPAPANYDDPPEDEDSTLDALLNYAAQSRPQIDPAKLASIAPKHDEIGKWIKAHSLPSGRLIDMMLDGLLEAHGKAMIKAA